MPAPRKPQFDTTEQDTEGFTGERPNVTEGEMKERVFPGLVKDAVFLHPDSLHEMGIDGAIPSCLADTAHPGDRVYIGPRAPATYGKLEPGHMRALKRRWKTIEFVTNEKGEAEYLTEHNILATVSREEYLNSRVARHVNAAEQFTRGLIQGRVDSQAEDGGLVENFNASDEGDVRRKYNEAHAALAGMKTKWPAGYTLEQIEEGEGLEKTIALEREYARGGRTERKNEYADWEKRQREKSAEMKRNRSKSFSFPGAPAGR